MVYYIKPLEFNPKNNNKYFYCDYALSNLKINDEKINVDIYLWITMNSYLPVNIFYLNVETNIGNLNSIPLYSVEKEMPQEVVDKENSKCFHASYTLGIKDLIYNGEYNFNTKYTFSFANSDIWNSINIQSSQDDLNRFNNELGSENVSLSTSFNNKFVYKKDGIINVSNDITYDNKKTNRINLKSFFVKNNIKGYESEPITKILTILNYEDKPIKISNLKYIFKYEDKELKFDDQSSFVVNDKLEVIFKQKTKYLDGKVVLDQSDDNAIEGFYLPLNTIVNVKVTFKITFEDETIDFTYMNNINFQSQEKFNITAQYVEINDLSSYE